MEDQEIDLTCVECGAEYDFKGNAFKKRKLSIKS